MTDFEKKYNDIIKRKKKPTRASVDELMAINVVDFQMASVINKCTVESYIENIFLPQMVADWKKKGGKKE